MTRLFFLLVIMASGRKRENNFFGHFSSSSSFVSSSNTQIPATLEANQRAREIEIDHSNPFARAKIFLED